MGLLIRFSGLTEYLAPEMISVKLILTITFKTLVYHDYHMTYWKYKARSVAMMACSTSLITALYSSADKDPKISLPFKKKIIKLVRNNSTQKNSYQIMLLNEYERFEPKTIKPKFTDSLIPQSSFKSYMYGDHAFSVCTPKLWNNLPEHIKFGWVITKPFDTQTGLDQPDLVFYSV